VGGVRPERLLTRLDAFARLGATPGGGVSRQALTEGDRAARALLARLAHERGFTVTQDAIANLFVCRAGTRRETPPLLIGSHLDTQPSGGRFDGALGVLTAFEVLEALEDHGVATNRDVVAVSWTNEEGSRFTPGAMGSRAFADRAILASWEGSSGRDGSRLGDELQATLAALDVPIRPLGFPVSAYLELHIEQGPVLEQAGIPIGIVEGIQGVRWLEARFAGQAAHAGTTPCEFRRDPMQAAARALDALYRSIMPRDRAARFTVGRLDALPGSVNAIPAQVTLTMDLRHPTSEALDRIEGEVHHEAENACRATGCTLAIERTVDMAPCAFDPRLLSAIADAAAALGLDTMRLTSGAYHDALFLAGVAPSAMIFLPSRNGLSHNEAEFTEARHIGAGAALMYAVVRSIAALDVVAI
jgi:beta-ureidopropionase / N-carbamoyl-L-amino-acid hydrolase